MKSKLVLVWVALVVCSSPIAAQTTRQTQNALDALLDRWTATLNTENIDDFLACYWDDAVRITYFPGSEPEITEGIAELRRSEMQAMEEYDYSSFTLVYDEPVRLIPATGRPTYVYANSQIGYMDVFEFERRGSEFRIIRQYLFPHPKAE